MTTMARPVTYSVDGEPGSFPCSHMVRSAAATGRLKK